MRDARARTCLTHPPCARDASARVLRAQGNHGPNFPSDIAAASPTAEGVRVMHVPCSSSGAGAGALRQAVPTVLGSAAAAVEMAHSGLS